jgi:hypothetical protein
MRPAYRSCEVLQEKENSSRKEPSTVSGTTYLHVLDGRLRIKVSDVKRSARRAGELTRELMAFDGIREVIANPTTGNVLIHFDPDHLDSKSIVRHLRALGYLTQRPTGVSRVAKGLALGITEIAFQRVFAALLL